MLKEDRLEMLERRTEALAERLRRLEGRIDYGPTVTRTTATAPTARVDVPPPAPVVNERVPVGRPRPEARPAGERPRPAAPRREVAVEDLLGGRVLAWLGGIAVLVGIAFFFALAISHGWIGPAARTLIAGAGALVLLGGGVWLHERKGQTDAAVAAAATAVAGLFATITVAAQVYHLVPAVVGLLLAAGVGVVATSLAIGWEARGVAALGVGGSLLAPVLVGAPSNTGTMAFLLLAGAAASAVLLWQRWDWLAFGAFLVSTPQWIAWLNEGASAAVSLAVLACFGVLNVAGAIGFELRMPSERLRRSATFLLALNALALATAGWFWLVDRDLRTIGEIWLGGLAAVHVVVGLSERRIERVSHEMGLVSLVLGVSLADVAYGLIVSGPALAVGWAAGAVGFAIIRKRTRDDGSDQRLAQVGLGAHVGLALVRTLVADAPPSAVSGHGGGMISAAVALSALAAACFASARLAEDGRPECRVGLDALGLAALAYLTAILLDGPALAIAWGGEAVALAQIARHGEDRVAAIAALAFAGLAGTHATMIEAPPSALVYGVHHLVAAAGTLVVVAVATLRMAQIRTGGERQGIALAGSGAVLLLYAASVAVVSAFQPGTSGVELSIFDLGARQQGQVLLSAMWSVVGVTALVVGLRRDRRGVRIAALGLLLAAVAKVFLYDLAALTSVYRVASFVGLGLLLLGAAFAWQRMRPRPLPDLRSTPGAVR
jgi:uncharacterized membrane protein